MLEQSELMRRINVPVLLLFPPQPELEQAQLGFRGMGLWVAGAPDPIPAWPHGFSHSLLVI